MRNFIASLVLALVLTSSGYAQVVGSNSPTKRFISGATLPATCAVGDVYFKTSSTLGQYNCTATDTWTLVATGSGLSGLTSGRVPFAASSTTLGDDGGFRFASAAGSDTLFIGLAGTSTGQLIYAGATSGSVTVKAQATAGTWSLALPQDNGDAGQFLKTDGSGVTSWADAGAPAIPANEIAYGTGSGLTSNTGLKYDPAFSFNGGSNAFALEANETLADAGANRYLAQFQLGVQGTFHEAVALVARIYDNDVLLADKLVGLRVSAGAEAVLGELIGIEVQDVGGATNNYAIKTAGAGDIVFGALKTTGAATGKTVVCVDTATGKLYASSSAVACAN